ncbi:MAG: 16S rRNA (cytosine(1402)-N(4))-methyltransferase RsmH [Pseudomonadota bacterium]|nr:16S rRNA (cytosine(1402)-N(4))-methyltransferase RsmH [Pseudomonadota bacterium]MEC8084358.1 16S rRNA (cytosine(1402)-N(4))-methyltransferase RsmH [Pseudomonadota bacterium]MEE3107106.1 16S rRNA (cytosine(1402)-N(4))-methyltransferase RsmH [Pseudomonadota bacterium]
MTTAASVHAPVLLNEVVSGLAVRDGGLYVDGTFGAGGYTAAILAAANCKVWAIDRDPDAIARGRDLAARHGARLTLVEGRFADMDRLVSAPAVDGVALDLGVSSPQLDQAARGFSFRFDGPLDMRMEREGPTAADIVNGESEARLADIIFHLGEERKARRIARAIVTARTTRPILRTGELASLVRGVVPAAPQDKIDPATRTFQALRLHVNGELEQLDGGLAAAERLLAPGGRLAVVSFHSLEDRRVKNFLRARAGQAPRPSRHVPQAALRKAPPTSFRDLARRPLRPADAETAANPRARSARLRLAERTDAAPWPVLEAV